MNQRIDMLRPLQAVVFAASAVLTSLSAHTQPAATPSVLSPAMSSTPSPSPSSKAMQLGRSERASIVITQAVPLGASSSTLTVRSGQIMTLSNRTLALDQDSTELAPVAGVTPMPYDNGTKTSDAVLEQAKTYLIGRASDLADQLRTFMSSNASQSAVYVYTHRLNVLGSPSIRQLVWTMTVLDSGKTFWSTPTMLDDDPSYVYMRYTPANVSDGLPADWGALLKQAGQVQWQLRKIKDNTALTEWASAPNFGALDRVSSNPDMAPNCLADPSYRWTDSTGTTQRCPQGLPSAQGLITQYSVSGGAVIDYIRQLTPVYASDGTAQVSVQLTERELALTDCNNGTLTNQGNFGATLKEQVDRYRYSPDTPPVTKISSASSAVTPPMTAYTKSMPEHNETKATLQNSIINPYASTASLVSMNSVRNLVPPVPPLKVTMLNACDPYTITDSTIDQHMAVGNWPNLTPTQGSVTCSATKDQFWVNVGQSLGQCHGGGCNSAYYDMKAPFTQGVPEHWCSMTAQNYKSHVWNPYCLQYDGANTVKLYYPYISSAVKNCGPWNWYCLNTLYKLVNHPQFSLDRDWLECDIDEIGNPYCYSRPVAEYKAQLTFSGGWQDVADITSHWSTICPGN